MSKFRSLYWLNFLKAMGFFPLALSTVFLFFLANFSFLPAQETSSLQLDMNSQEFFPLAKVKVGDILTAKTRIDNNKMHEFKLRVMSIVRRGVENTFSKSILAVSDDPYIAEVGVASGMSGSPVYYGERLVGAIAYTFRFLKKPVAGITPIETMLPIINYQGKEPDNSFKTTKENSKKDSKETMDNEINQGDYNDSYKDISTASFFDWQKFWYESSLKSLSRLTTQEFYDFLKQENTRLQKKGLASINTQYNSLGKLIEFLKSGQTGRGGKSLQNFSPALNFENKNPTHFPKFSFPITVSYPGFQEEVSDNLFFRNSPPGWGILQKQIFPHAQLSTAPSFPSSMPTQEIALSDKNNQSNGNSNKVSIVPGDYISVNFIRGDIEMGSFGTVTYVKGDTLLAFGHAMNNRGSVRLPLYKARTEMIMPLQDISFKMGSLVKEIGTLEQDRQTGVLGKIGTRASYIPMQVSLHTPLRKRSYHFEVVNDKLYSPSLFAFVVRQIFFLKESQGRFGDIEYEIRADYEFPSAKEQSVSENNSVVISNRVDIKNNQYGMSFVANDVTTLMSLIRENDQDPAIVTNLSVKIKTRPRYNYMRAVTVRKFKKVYQPGEVMRFEVGFDRYQKPRIFKEFTYQIPGYIKNGSYQLAISPAVLRWLTEVILAKDKYTFRSLDGILKFLNSRPPSHQISVWHVEGEQSVWIKDKVYRHLPANQQKILLNSLHSEKNMFVDLKARDYNLEETVEGFLTLSYQVKQTYKE